MRTGCLSFTVYLKWKIIHAKTLFFQWCLDSCVTIRDLPRCAPEPHRSRRPKQLKGLKILAAEWTLVWLLDWSFSRNKSKQVKSKCTMSRGSIFDYQRAGKTLGVAELISWFGSSFENKIIPWRHLRQQDWREVQALSLQQHLNPC